MEKEDKERMLECKMVSFGELAVSGTVLDVRIYSSVYHHINLEKQVVWFLPVKKPRLREEHWVLEVPGGQADFVASSLGSASILFLPYDRPLYKLEDISLDDPVRGPSTSSTLSSYFPTGPALTEQWDWASQGGSESEGSEVIVWVITVTSHSDFLPH